MFNAFLDATFKKVGILKEWAKDGKIFAFADNMLAFADTKEEAKIIIDAVTKLESFGLQHNKHKTKIISEFQGVEVGQQIAGIER